MPKLLRRLFPKERHRLVSASPAPVPPVAAGEGSWFEAKRKRQATVGLAREHYRDPAQVAAVEKRLKPLLDQPEVVTAIERDDIPIPAKDDREGYFGDRHLSYWLSGLDDLRVVRSLAPQADFSQVLDFGGASGRFARHVALSEPSASVIVADLNLNHILWCDQHFGSAVRGMKVSEFCHFPLADRSISLCVGLSVFTHIDSYETGWLAEIHRVLQDRGYAFLTVHSEHTWPLLANKAGILAALRADPAFVAVYQPDAPMPAERMAFYSSPDSISRCCNTFVHTDYVRRVWGKWFEVVGIHPRAHHGFQTAVILRKR